MTAVEPTTRMTFKGAAIAIAATLSLAACATPAKVPEHWDELQQKPVPGFDSFYLRPQADFRKYGNIVVKPVQVSFDKNWDPNSTQRDITRHLSAEDIQKLKDEMVSNFREVFARELTEGGYTIAEQGGADSLVAQPSLTDVYINAPDVMAPGRDRTYTRESGRMTLVLELLDGGTGQVVGGAVDREISGNNLNRFEITNSVTNTSDFRRAVADWADRLRRELDTLRTKAMPPPTS